MKIKTSHSSSKKMIILAACAILLGLVIFLTYLYFGNHSSPIDDSKTTSGVNTVDYSAPSKDQANPATDPQSNSSQSPSTSDLEVAITSTNQNNGMLQIRSLITPILGSGTCHLELSKLGSPSLRSDASVQNLSSSSTCQGFDIAIASLSPGVWRVVLSVESGNRSGTTSSEVSIE